MWRKSNPPTVNHAPPFRPEVQLPFVGLNVKIPRPAEYKDFTSNDYLGLTSDPSLRTLFLEKLANEPYVLGARSVRLLDGNTTAHTELERRLQRFYNAQEALIFNSGYDANLSVFSCLPRKGDVIVFDQYVHASARDGMRLSPARFSLVPFEHNSPDALRNVLTKVLADNKGVRNGTAKVFIALESLYSMDGDFAPLAELVAVCEELLPHPSMRHLVIDEAHSVGSFGASGWGLVSLLGLEEKFDIRVHTFSKGLANMGGE
jgi:8-amino-7-oxononanoate synthase